MNIINTFAMNVSALFGYAGYPSSSAYTSIRVYGDNIYDYLHIKNVELTEAEMDALPLYTNPTWDGNTVLLALFEGNLSGGNISGIINPITNWVIQRKKSTESVYTTIGTVDSTATSFIDLTVESGYTYEYQVFGINDTEISDPLFNSIDSSFYNHILIDTVTGVAIIFDVNLEFGGYNEETAFEVYNGYNKYPSFSIGNRRYKTGSASAIVHEEICVGTDLVQTVDYIKTIDDFINNGNDKIMKDRKGNVLRVKTVGGMQQSPFNINVTQQPYVLTFNFTESGEVD